MNNDDDDDWLIIDPVSEYDVFCLLSNIKQSQLSRRHLVLANTEQLDSNYFGYTSWNVSQITSCFRCDFDRCQPVIDGLVVLDRNKFIYITKHHLLQVFDNNYKISDAFGIIRLACTQIVVAPIVVKLHTIYSGFGGCVCELPSNGHCQDRCMHITIDTQKCTIHIQKRMAIRNIDVCNQSPVPWDLNNPYSSITCLDLNLYIDYCANIIKTFVFI